MKGSFSRSALERRLTGSSPIVVIGLQRMAPLSYDSVLNEAVRL